MIKRKVGRRIRRLREDKNMSQEKLANKIGLDRTYISSVESGNRNISIINLEKIIKVGLNTDLSDFFNNIDEEWKYEKRDIIKRI